MLFLGRVVHPHHMLVTGQAELNASLVAMLATRGMGQIISPTADSSTQSTSTVSVSVITPSNDSATSNTDVETTASAPFYSSSGPSDATPVDGSTSATSMQNNNEPSTMRK
jgi:hypothetical protein